MSLTLIGSRQCNDLSQISQSIVAVMGVQWNSVRPLSSSIVSAACFAWFIIELDDPFPLAACVAMACKAIFELSITGLEIND